MKVSKVSLIFTIGLLVMVLLTAALPVSAAQPETVRVWVTYQSGRKAEVFQALNRAEASLLYDFPELEAYVVSLPEAALNGILRNPFVVGVEGDPERYPVEPVASPAGSDTVDKSGQTVPWGIDAVQARDVWDENRDAVVDEGAPTGAGITVCIIDTGYYAEHEDLMDSDDSVTGYSQVDDNYLRDIVGHGSHVAGTIAALNNGLGVVGVSPGEVDLHIVKIFDDTGAWVTRASDLTAAIFNCRDNGAKVISMSLSGSRANKQEERAFNELYQAGILHVAAAGNHQIETPGALHYPASYASVISVAAVDASLAVADFSAQNAPVELAAPGVGVLSTVPFLDITTLDVAGTLYTGNRIEYSPANTTVSGDLVDGGLCLETKSWSGLVVLCERGDISFYDKVMNVQSGGGVAAVIYNNEEGDFWGTLGDGYTSEIIGVTISQALGQFLVGEKLGATATITNVYEAPPSSGYEAWAGTSMATPHVAGVAALVWSANATWTNAQIREALTATAFELGAAGRDIAFGYGLVQAANALAFLGGGVEPPPPPPDTPLVVTINSPADGATVTGSVLIAVNVTANSTAVSGAAVTLTLTGTKSAPVTLTDVTDANGDLSLTYTINSRRMGTGTYTLSVSATKDGYQSGSATRTFIVQ